MKQQFYKAKTIFISYLNYSNVGINLKRIISHTQNSLPSFDTQAMNNFKIQNKLRAIYDLTTVLSVHRRVLRVQCFICK